MINKHKGKIVFGCITLILIFALIMSIVLLMMNGNLKQEINVLYQQVSSNDTIKEDYDQSLLRIHALEKQVDTFETEHIDLNKVNEELKAECERLNGVVAQQSSELTTPSLHTFDPEKVFDKVVYLTFDDGPSYNTLKILKILRRYHIKATFFVNHTSYGHDHNVYKQIVEAGHAIGNHTYHHLLPADDVDAFYEDFMLMDDYIYEMTGVRTMLFRFPGGSSSKWENKPDLQETVRKLTDAGYMYFDWNVSNNDSRNGYGQLSAEELVAHVKTQAPGKNPAVVLMHDRSSGNATVEALPDVIEYYRSKGYVFLPLHDTAYRAAFYRDDDAS